MPSCVHPILKKIGIPQEGTIVLEYHHGWYKCTTCGQVIFLAQTMEYDPERLREILAAAEHT
jgi:hypothetical protein